MQGKCFPWISAAWEYVTWGYLFPSASFIFLLVFLFSKEFPRKFNDFLVSRFNDNIRPYPVASFFAGAVLAILLITYVPSWQAQRAGIEKPAEAQPDLTKAYHKVIFDVENESRKTLAQILGGLAALVAFYFMWKKNQLTYESQIIDREGQITDRFTKAVAQLGDENIAIRLGGIYALERIAHDSERDHWAVMEVLTAFVREKAPVSTKEEDKAGEEASDEGQKKEIGKDIQAILTVIARRKHLEKEEKEGKRLDLSNTDLRGADMSKKGNQEINLKNVIFFRSNLSGADLSEAQLQGSDLCEANLQGALLGETKLQMADLSFAQLQGANLGSAHLCGADLGDAYLQGAWLDDACLQGALLFSTQLQGAYLIEAQLQGADLREAQLQGADLQRAQLQGADFSNAQLQGAVLKETQLQGTHFYEAQLQGTDLTASNLTGAYLSNAKIRGVRFDKTEIKGVICDFLDNDSKDSTDYSDLIAKAPELFRGLEEETKYYIHSLEATKKEIEEAQKNPPLLPDELKTDADGFVELNISLAMSDSFIAQGLLSPQNAFLDIPDEHISHFLKRGEKILKEIIKYPDIENEIRDRGKGSLIDNLRANLLAHLQQELDKQNSA